MRMKLIGFLATVVLMSPLFAAPLYGFDTNQRAYRVVGKPNMTTGVPANISTARSYSVYLDSQISSDGTRLVVADSSNNRVLIYNTIPATDNPDANVVIGQPNMTSYSANQGGAVGANTLSMPFGVFTDGTRLFISDSGNNRVLIYNTIPTTNNTSADIVIGQANMTGKDANQGNGSNPAANTLFFPMGIYSDGTKMYIVDTKNNRVLIYNTIPAANNASADVAVGQPNMTEGFVNQLAGSVGANTMNNPGYVFKSESKLFVSDTLNYRVLIYNTVPTVNNASADVVIGQPNMTSNSANQGGSAGANTLQRASGIATDGTKLFITDMDNNRVLIYNTVPASNNASADVVLGQPDMATSGSHVISAITLSYPCDVGWYGQKLMVSDCNNGRVLFFSQDAPPTQSSYNMTTGMLVTTRTPTVTFSTNENATCRWAQSRMSYLGMDAANTCSGSGTKSQSCALAGLVYGPNDFYFTCTDTSGNSDMADDGKWLVLVYNDITPPVQSAHTPPSGTSLNTDSVTIHFTLDEAGGCEWSFEDHGYSPMDGDCTGHGTTEITCPVTGLTNGVNTISLSCYDESGNDDDATQNTELVYTVNVAGPDTMPPVQSSHSPAAGTGIYASTVDINFALNENGDCKWAYSDQAYSAMTNDCTGDGTANQTCHVTGLGDGSNTIFIACKDTPGNTDTAVTNTHIAYTVSLPGYNSRTNSTFLYICPPVSAENLAKISNAKVYSGQQFVDIDLSTLTGCKGIYAKVNGIANFKIDIPATDTTFTLEQGWNMLYNPYDHSIEYDATHFSVTYNGTKAPINDPSVRYLVSDFASISTGNGRIVYVPSYDAAAIPSFTAFMIKSGVTGATLTITP